MTWHRRPEWARRDPRPLILAGVAVAAGVMALGLSLVTIWLMGQGML